MPLTLETFLDEPPAALRLMLVEPAAIGDTIVERLSVFQGQPVPSDAALLVGPEGGWTDEELATARAHGRAARDARSAHAARRRGPDRRDQRAAVHLGRSVT